METLNDVSSTEVLSVNETAVELGTSQSICGSLSGKSGESGKILDFLL